MTPRPDPWPAPPGDAASTLLALAPVALATLDAAGCVRWANPRFAALVPGGLAALRGRPLAA
ncbi:MAG TPA: hypothetical protein VLU41_08450, partial [Ideonella sp.]|nr:hypothetical protein [Ideonella sp.]